MSHKVKVFNSESDRMSHYLLLYGPIILHLASLLMRSTRALENKTEKQLQLKLFKRLLENKFDIGKESINGSVLVSVIIMDCCVQYAVLKFCVMHRV